jgi:hypothetical protein
MSRKFDPKIKILDKKYETKKLQSPKNFCSMFGKKNEGQGYKDPKTTMFHDYSKVEILDQSFARDKDNKIVTIDWRRPIEE